MLEFRLVYQGLLPSNGDRARKHAIRRYLHRQLVDVWKTKSPLKERLGPGNDPEEAAVIMSFGTRHNDLIKSIKGKRFLPIVQEDLSLECSLDVLLLSHSPHKVVERGDLDNRMKTLLDALTMPNKNDPPGEGDEDPLYCLLENDKYVSELRVVGDFLFAVPDQVIASPRVNERGEEVLSKSHVFAVIYARIKKTRVRYHNGDF